MDVHVANEVSPVLRDIHRGGSRGGEIGWSWSGGEFAIVRHSGDRGCDRERNLAHPPGCRKDPSLREVGVCDLTCQCLGSGEKQLVVHTRAR